MKRILYSLFAVMCVITISSAQIQLLKDIRPGVQLPDLGPGLTYKGYIYYQGYEYSGGFELWRTDGTPEGTTLFKDIFPGNDNRSYPDQFIIFNDILYFTAEDANGRELWRTDGTAAGTVMVADINPGPASSDPRDLIVFNGKLYFHATDPSHGNEIWMTDGSNANTKLLFDACPGSQGSASDAKTANIIVPFNGSLYFSVMNVSRAPELWKTNGTAESTMIVKQLYGDTFGFIPFIVTVNSKLIFGAWNNNACKIWISDGTTAGTEQLGDIITSGAEEIYPTQDQVIGNYLFFGGAHDTANRNFEVWKTDGTLPNTVQVVDTNGDPEVESLPVSLFAIDDVLYFSAVPTNENVYGSQSNLYKSTGAVGNATLIDSGYPVGGPPMNLTEYNGLLTFAGKSRFNWYDGTTLKSVDTRMGANRAAIHFIELNDILYFSSQGFYKFDGSTVTLIGQPTASENSSNPSSFTDGGNGVIYLAADDGVNGKELWRSNGPGDASIVKDINSSGASNPDNLRMYNGKLYFSANDGSSDEPQIWKSDGTAAGTEMILASQQTQYNGIQHSSIIHAGALFIAAYDGLWKVEGDAPPARIAAAAYITPGTLTSTSTYLYFLAYNHETFACNLYKSDGTVAGTMPVANNISGCIGPTDSPEDIIEFNSKIYYDGYGPTGQSELWSYDGTSSAVVKSSTSGGPGNPGNFSVVGNNLFFGGNDTSHGYELWKTDGTDANTVLVKDIKQGPESGLFTSPGHGPPISMFFQHVAFNGKLYFGADDGVHGRELWISDGTDAGTTLLNDLAPGATPGLPSKFVVLDNSLYFLGADEAVQQYGNNVYVTNGLACGTRKITSSVYNTSLAQNLTAVGSKLLVSLYDTKIGQEPFVIDPSQIPPPPEGCVSNPGSLMPPTALTFSDVGNDGMTVSFTASPPPAAGYIILMRAGQSPDQADLPVAGKSYQAGEDIGSSVVAGSGTQTAWVFKQLMPATIYYFEVFVFDANHNYLTGQPLAGSQQTNSINDPQIDSISFPEVTATTITVALSPGTPAPEGYLTLMSTSPASGDLPQNEVTYTPGDKIGTSMVVGFGTNTRVDVASLDPDTQYFFNVIPYKRNGANYDYVIVSKQSASQRTLKGPEIVDIAFPIVTDNAITVAITPGEREGNGYIILMNASSYPTDVPKDGNLYQIGSSVGSSTVVGFGADTTVNVTSLQPSTEYFFSVYPYLQSGNVYDYITNHPISGRQQTSEVTTAVEDSKEARPAYPNPFTEVLTIPFYSSTNNAQVHVIIYDQVGRVVAEVVNTTFETGNHEVSWDRTDGQGNKVQAGMYLYQVKTSGGVIQGLVIAK